MPNLLYFDAYSGLSGDMTLGALLHLGMPLEYLQAELAKLQVPGFSLEKKPVEQFHISGIKLDVRLENEQDHVYRSVKDIEKIIIESQLAPRVQERAIAVFWSLARVEGQIHNVPPEQVHFHEVGAVDAIVDIVGSCIGFEYFDIDEFYCSPLPVGSGFVQAAHGLMPVPAPATLELLAQAGAALAPTTTLSNGAEYPARAEMVTPTGAALVTTLCKHGIGNRPQMALKGVGYGFGSREFAWPNALRLWLGSILTNSSPNHPPLNVLDLQELPSIEQTAQTHSHSHEDEHSHSHSDEGEDGHTHSHSHENGHSHSELKHHEHSAPVEFFQSLTPSGLESNTAQETFYGLGEVSVIETNLDDMTGEGLGYLMERLLAEKALDVYFTPIFMKKNRPATKLSVVAHPVDEARLAALIIKESSTFGVRCYRMNRYTTGRQFQQVSVSGGSAQIKLKIVDGEIVEAVPEYDSVAALARQTGQPWREIYEEVRQAAQELVVKK